MQEVELYYIKENCPVFTTFLNHSSEEIESIKQKTGDDSARSSSSVMGDCVSLAGTPAQNQMKIELLFLIILELAM